MISQASKRVVQPTALTTWMGHIDAGRFNQAVALSQKFNISNAFETVNRFKTWGEERKEVERAVKLHNDAGRFDAADAVIATTGFGVAEEYRKVVSKAALVRSAPTPCMDNFPIVGPEVYEFYAEEYIRQSVRATGTPAPASGADDSTPKVELITVPASIRTLLWKLGWDFSWGAQQRQKVQILDIDVQAQKAANCRKILAEIYPEKSFLQGTPSRGVYGILNHPSIMVSTVDPLSYGTTDMQSWGESSTALGDILAELKRFLRNLRSRTPATDGGSFDLMVPKWFDTMSGGTVNLVDDAGVSFRTLRDAIKAYGQGWIRNWIVNPWLDSIDTDGTIAVNVLDQPTLTSSRIIAAVNADDVFHFVQPLMFEQLPPWQKGPAVMETMCYESDGGVFVGNAQMIGTLVC